MQNIKINSDAEYKNKCKIKICRQLPLKRNKIVISITMIYEV